MGTGSGLGDAGAPGETGLTVGACRFSLTGTAVQLASLLSSLASMAACAHQQRVSSTYVSYRT